MQESPNAKVISSYASFVQGQYYSVAARVPLPSQIALFLWDYFVTFDREVEYVWGQKLSAASLLFILNRYVNLLITILELIEQAPFQTPASLLIFATFIVAVSNLRESVFVTLRVYATWSRDWRPALPILALALLTPAANMYIDIIGTPIPAPRPSVGCAIRTNIDPGVYSTMRLRVLIAELVVIAERATTTAYDFLILLFTLMKTAKVRKAALSLDVHPSLMVLLLRDGTTYFLLLLVMNLAQIVVAAEVLGNNFIAFFISPLTSILITRFLLNLRQLAHTSASAPQFSDSEASRSAIISTQFPSMHLSFDILGNMGAPLRSGFDGDSTEVSFEQKLRYAGEPLLAGLVKVEDFRAENVGQEEMEMEHFV
ncbi:hypothetical protein OH76DRAFT_1420098 [Lentinus brumalis]|uniref:DUF6533 domain-containing protein n=1 Tax=Lentinus brumalis TaxID=2498619 RepID=A0A371D2E2_9APHY|nr:hypothetical protein OH76DRAFT_1420098 [Polyporus brumalis]